VLIVVVVVVVVVVECVRGKGYFDCYFHKNVSLREREKKGLLTSYV
jgi:hypothetical protein